MDLFIIDFFYGNEKECLEWLVEQEKKSKYLQDYYLNYLLANNEAFNVKYLDGSRVYYFKPSLWSKWQTKSDLNGEEI